MRKIATLTVPLLALVLAGRAPAADTKFDAEALAKAVAPYLDDRTVAVIHVDLPRVDLDPFFALVARFGVLDAKQLDAAKQAVTAQLKAARDAGIRDVFVVVSLADLPNHSPFLVVPVGKNTDTKAAAAALEQLHLFSGAMKFTQLGDALIGAEEATLKRLKDLKPDARPEIAQALAAAGDGAAQAVLVATTDTRKILEETLPTLPPELGGGSIKTLTRGLKWVTVKADFAPKVTQTYVIQAADKESAKAIQELLEKAVKVLGETKEVKKELPEFPKIAAQFMPQLDGDGLVLVWDEKKTEALAPIVKRMRGASERAIAQNNLKQILLAMHNYLDANKRFPAVANFDKQNKPLLSWRVHLLPYLGEEKLYKEFKLDEPWDSEHNKKLIARMPKVYAAPGGDKLAAQGKTTYVGAVHKGNMFTGTKQGVRIQDVTDGLSNTIFVVDADDDHAVIWTKPDDLKYDPDNPAKGLATRYGDGYLVGVADGSVHLLPKTIDKKTLQALFTRNGGEVVNWP